MEGFRFEADIRLLEVLEGFGRAVGGVNVREGLAEADVQMEADRRGGAVDGDLSHVDVQRVRAVIEIAELVVTRIRVVEVGVDVAVEQEAEIHSAPDVNGDGAAGAAAGAGVGVCAGVESGCWAKAAPASIVPPAISTQIQLFRM